MSEHFFDKQISLTEWFQGIKHDDVLKHRDEDNEKRERLRALNKIIDLPFDKPVQFSAVDIAEKTPEFQKYFNEHGSEKCALRLIPYDSSLEKLRMRGLTVHDVVTDWFPKQNIDPEKYRADFMGHSDVNYWSTIFVVTDKGITGEIIADSHEKLTQGFYDEHKPIMFSYDFKTWTLSRQDEEAQKHLEHLISFLYVNDSDKQLLLINKLNAKFVSRYLKGYFESVDTDQGVWFIDYNRLLVDDIPQFLTDEKISAHTVSGNCASGGVAKGRVRIISDPEDDSYFSDGDILVCDMTSPQYVPFMVKAGGIVTDRGGITSHAAIVARELKKPCIVGTDTATEVLKNGDFVEVDADNKVVKVLEKVS
ncbi:hypothetical protein KC866_00375 [Patescibacteria group bacterium]|nr:hypothetical protein [Patescibacteria group bacterium]